MNKINLISCQKTINDNTNSMINLYIFSNKSLFSNRFHVNI